jgi:fibrillarin-like pre-rRNA processing protein
VTAPERWKPRPDSPRLLTRRVDGGVELWTESVGSPPPVYGERWKAAEGRFLRTFEPGRSKLSAGLVRGWAGPLPSVGERWLYLGAASGTTASHIADLVGPEGRIYAVERSPRPFARLLALAARWPNLLPILGDARDPARYADLVPDVDGLYADVAQPDQIALARSNAELFLRGAGASILLALKTASLGRDLTPAAHLARSERELASLVRLSESVRLDPFHRGHYLLGGRAAPSAGASVPRPATSRRGPPPGRRRR